MSPENSFILGSKDQRSRSRVTKNIAGVAALVVAFLWVLASSSWYYAGRRQDVWYEKN